MGGVQGVNGLPPTPDRPSDVKDRQRTDQATKPAGDGVQISSEAQKAAETARFSQLAAFEPDIRQDRVAEARGALERGEYKLENRIAEVARKFLQIL
jgi:flagellar biosynthesis anti-sigma factor FlgM